MPSKACDIPRTTDANKGAIRRFGLLLRRSGTALLRAVNTGHPGSFSTIHANSCAGALEQLALMVMQRGIGLSRGDTLAYARSVIDIVVQLERRDGARTIVEIAETAGLAAATAIPG